MTSSAVQTGMDRTPTARMPLSRRSSRAASEEVSVGPQPLALLLALKELTALVFIVIIIIIVASGEGGGKWGVVKRKGGGTYPATKSSLMTPPQALPSSLSIPGKTGKVLGSHATAVPSPPPSQLSLSPRPEVADRR